MNATNACPKCGHHELLKTTPAKLCPSCGEDLSAETAPAKPTLTRFIGKGILAAALGMAPGAIYLAFGQPLEFCVMLMVPGAFIGLAFAYAKLSARNMAEVAAMVVVAKAIPPGLHGPVIRALEGNDEVRHNASTHASGDDSNDDIPRVKMN